MKNTSLVLILKKKKMVYNFEEKSYKSTTGNAQRSKTAVCFLNSAGSISPSDDVT